MNARAVRQPARRHIGDYNASHVLGVAELLSQLGSEVLGRDAQPADRPVFTTVLGQGFDKGLRVKRRDGHRQLDPFAVAEDGHGGLRAGRRGGHHISQLVPVRGRLAVEFHHNVAGLQARLGGGAVRIHFGDQYARSAFKSKRLGQFLREVLYDSAQHPPVHSAMLEYALHD